MDLFNHDLMYEFHVRALSQTDALKQYSNHAVREIKSVAGWDADVHVHIEPEAKDKHLFSVSMSVFGLGNKIVVKKEGKDVLATLRKVRKAVLRQMHELSKRKFSYRKNRTFKQQFVS
jgi:ribosome-associated translation inhibitor RaiA